MSNMLTSIFVLSLAIQTGLAKAGPLNDLPSEQAISVTKTIDPGYPPTTLVAVKRDEETLLPLPDWNMNHARFTTHTLPHMGEPTLGINHEEKRFATHTLPHMGGPTLGIIPEKRFDCSADEDACKGTVNIP
ncbi:hypothetical protein MW887_005809 [Aspergillus wentii]|nr:hypothetical protein MW887_005809 [Aspergillus wentii]